MVTRALHAIYPPDSSCSSCRGQRDIRIGWGVCETCLGRLPDMLDEPPTPPEGIDRLMAYGPYDGALEEWIKAFKFNDQRHFDRLFGQLMRMTVEPYLPWEPDIVTPIPLFPKKQRDRGYNQAMVLARVLQEHTSWQVLDTLNRIRDTLPQVSLDEQKRRENLLDAFALRSDINVKGKRVLLIDDVTTTGSTLSECAKVLREHGAMEVTALTLAVTHRRIENTA